LEAYLQMTGRGFTPDLDPRLDLRLAGVLERHERYAEAAAAIVDASRDIYGELPSFDYGTYTFLSCYLPWVSGDGMEHRNSTILTSTGSLATNMTGLLGPKAMIDRNQRKPADRRCDEDVHALEAVGKPARQAIAGPETTGEECRCQARRSVMEHRIGQFAVIVGDRDASRITAQRSVEQRSERLAHPRFTRYPTPTIRGQ
jgi:hypothetical protein